jgi:hypothetical protein
MRVFHPTFGSRFDQIPLQVTRTNWTHHFTRHWRQCSRLDQDLLLNIQPLSCVFSSNIAFWIISLSYFQFRLHIRRVMLPFGELSLPTSFVDLLLHSWQYGLGDNRPDLVGGDISYMAVLMTSGMSFCSFSFRCRYASSSGIIMCSSLSYGWIVSAHEIYLIFRNYLDMLIVSWIYICTGHQLPMQFFYPFTGIALVPAFEEPAIF